MRLNNLPVAVKLWGVVLGSMGAMLTLAFSLLVFAERTAEQVNAKTQAADVRIATTMRWKALTELSTERFLVSATSSEPMACRTVLRLISNLSQSSASLGSRSPTRSARWLRRTEISQ